MAQQILSTPPIAERVSVVHRYSRSWALGLLFLDIAMFVLASYAAMHVVALWRPWRDVFEARVYISAGIFILIWIGVFQLVGLYERSFALSMKDEFYCTVAALCVGIAPQLLLFSMFRTIASSRLVLIVALFLSIAFVGSTRALVHLVRTAESRRRPRRIALVGHPDRLAAARAALQFGPIDEVRRFEVDSLDSAFGEINLTEDPELDRIPWFAAAKQWNSDQIIFTEVVHADLLPHLLEITEKHRIKIAFAPPRLKRQAFNLAFETNGHQALVVPRSLRLCRAPARLIKRIFDLIIASIMLVLLAPIILIVALTIWMQHSGPILYRQQRVTRGGRLFDITKFRTMPVTVEDGSGPIWAKAGDGRPTRLGAFLRKTSLDELPQLFNVLAGDMSLVGPRPERPMFAELFRGYLPRYDERHLVCPGITGWSHVHMRRDVPISDIGVRLSHDLYYIENWSVFMDISVLFKTGLEFLFQKAV